MQKIVRKKALVYCVWKGQLLVFRHADHSSEEVGIQVPSGTVNEGESTEEAALRELCEETGHENFTIRAFLGSTLYDQSPGRAEIHERYFYLASPTGDLPDRWESWEDHDGKRPPTRFECFWIPVERGHILQAGQSCLLWRLADYPS